MINLLIPENAAGGSLRLKDYNETKKVPLRFMAYSFGFVEEGLFKTQSEFISYLKNWNFETSQYNKILFDVKGIMQNYLELEK